MRQKKISASIGAFWYWNLVHHSKLSLETKGFVGFGNGDFFVHRPRQVIGDHNAEVTDGGHTFKLTAVKGKGPDS